MKKIIVLVFSLHFMTLLFASDSFDQYISMKKEANKLYKNGKTDDAINLVKDFINEHPKSIRSQNLLAVYYYWSGDFVKSQGILKSILKKENFPQAASLLKRVEKKIGKEKPKKIKKAAKTKAVKKETVKTVATNKMTIDLISLVNKIKNDPYDIESRKILSKHYDKIGNSQKAIYFANEVLKINPDDKEMIAYLKSKDIKKSSSASSEVLQKAVKKLEILFKNGSYDRFMNLYSSLEHNNVVMPTQVHVNALYCAISLKQYKKAKSILHIYRMPKNRHIAEIQKLVDEKLMLSRFASADDCNGDSCPIRR
jgi:tetratricopeptide (TPR) repeat protein